jgi:hypothetical protein
MLSQVPVWRMPCFGAKIGVRLPAMTGSSRHSLLLLQLLSLNPMPHAPPSVVSPSSEQLCQGRMYACR